MRKPWIAVGVSVLVFGCLCFSPWGEAQDKLGVTAEQAWLRLKQGNARFVADKLETKDLGKQRRQALAQGQAPFAVVWSCADSRVPPELVFNQGLGDLFVLRVAGNISDPFVLGSIEYALEHLRVPLIVVLGHEDCGAVKAAFGERPAGNLGKLIAEVHIGKNLPTDRKAALPIAVNNNVRHHTDLLTARSDVVKKHVADKSVRIVSGVYSLGTGKVDWLEPK
jgi:carbonic anhydrase